tara:strand:- start:4160 stop:5086 length:927 start_codon:yes stop_codon:yes gene_type:complete
MGFKDLKKQSRSGGFDKLSSELNKLAKKGSDSYKDDRFWRPELDKSSNGYAVIRFLPPVDGEDIPWVRVFNHGFQGPGGWMIENCPTTIGKKCPVCEANGLLWNSGDESDKDIARNRKRRLSYVSNIMVVKDPTNPENEGKVFLYKYGKKIHDKIVGAMQPEFDDETPLNPFDFWKGADFKLKIRKVAGFVNYDASEFASTSALLDGDDDALEAIWKQQYALQEFVAPDKFKSYDELKTRLDVVLGNAAVTKSAEDVDTPFDSPAEKATEKSFGKPSFDNKKTKVDVKDDSDDSEDALSYFEQLASED